MAQAVEGNGPLEVNAVHGWSAAATASGALPEPVAPLGVVTSREKTRSQIG